MKPEMKKLIIANLPYLLFVYLFGKLGQAYRLAEGIDLSQKLLHFADGCAAAFESAAPSFHPTDLLIGVAGAAALRLMVYCKGKNAKKYRKGVEYGSARWGGPKDIAPYIDPNFDNNILLTQTERITMNNRPKDPKTARNKNVLVIGGSGSGKTRFFVKPNLMQCVSKDYPTSFVITDPKGGLLYEYSNKSEPDRPRCTSVRDRRRSIYCESDRQRRRERNRSQENPSAAPKRFEQGSHLKIKDFFISYKQTDGA